jgi:hypothetical protein
MIIDTAPDNEIGKKKIRLRFNYISLFLGFPRLGAEDTLGTNKRSETETPIAPAVDRMS